MTDPASQSTSSLRYGPGRPWERSAPTPVELQLMPGAAARIEGHEAALRALVSQLEGAVQLAGFSVTEVWVLPEILHDEPSDDVTLVLTVAGFERRDELLELWTQLSNLASENDNPLISTRCGLVVRRATP